MLEAIPLNFQLSPLEHPSAFRIYIRRVEGLPIRNQSGR